MTTPENGRCPPGGPYPPPARGWGSSVWGEVKDAAWFVLACFAVFWRGC